MDLNSLGKFKKYKNDWNYPVQVLPNEKIKVPNKKCTSFMSAIKITVIVGQCFGLNPVLGVCEKRASKLRFKFISWRCLYSFMCIIGQFGMGCFLVISLFREDSSVVDSATALIFYFFGLLTTVLFLRIAKKWPKLCIDISEMEAADPTTDSKLGIKLNVLCCVILMLAFLEHLFSELHGISIAIDCEPEIPVYEGFIRHSFSWIYAVVPYTTLSGIIAHFINIQCTFNWNFTDIFVMCMSIYLTSRLEQVSLRVVSAKDKKLSSSLWRSIREDYNRAAQLVRQVDNIIGGVVFISFASNLFFVCSQLLHTFAGGIKATDRCRNDRTPDSRYMAGYEHSIYFAYSFVFLVARSLAVSLIASRVHAASLEPAFGLYDVASTTYCIEIAGTIVTYELVLMQFTGITPASPSPL